MIKFPKTDGLYVRDADDPKVVTTRHRHDVYKQIKGWWAEEKVDGTNCRIILHPGEPKRCDVRGRSDSAQLSKPLREALEAAVFRAHTTEEWELLHRITETGAEPICLYGEGIGPGVNGNPHELDRCEFVMFDMKRGTHPERGWSPPAHVHKVAAGLGLYSASVLSENVQLMRAEAWVRNGFKSAFGGVPAEGVVLKVRSPMYDGRGRLVRLKLKQSNLPTVAVVPKVEAPA